MSQRSEMEQFIQWASGEGLNKHSGPPGRDYHALNAVKRFRSYQARVAEENLKELQKRQVGDDGRQSN